MKTGLLKLVAAVLSITLVFCSAFPIYAMEETGSVSVSLKEDGKGIPDAGVTLYKVASAKKLLDGFGLAFTEKFSNFNGKTQDIGNDSFASAAADYVHENGLTGVENKTDSNGSAFFGNLDLGVYLALQSESVDGYTDFAPFIITVPVEENGDYVYNVQAEPKTDIMHLVDISVHKVWNDDQSASRPNSVEIALYKDNDIVDTAVLNNENNWQFTWKNYPKNDSYSVKEINVPNGYTVTYSKTDFDFTVTNTSVLIKTGQLQWPIPVLAVSGLILFVIGWKLTYKKKNEKA